MSDIESKVRTLIDQSEKNLSEIARETGVEYQRLWRWHSEKSSILRANDAAVLTQFLTDGGEA